MKIAFVVQRCGVDVFGGAEALTFQVAKNLSKIHDIEILTCRAKDAGTWKDWYPEGIEKIDNLIIRRFSVDNERDPKFVSLANYLESNESDLQKGIEFINTCGPVCSKLIEFIKKKKDDFDLFVFVGYIYWQTFYGLQEVKEKSLLLPTAHDEHWIHFKIYEKVFELPLGYLFLTNAEKNFVIEKFGHKDKPSMVVGHGVELPNNIFEYKSKIQLPANFILYVGRISSGKGCDNLIKYFQKYLEIKNIDLKLVMIGNMEQNLQGDNIIFFENLSDNDKFFILNKSKIFIMPSQNESLNIACLEAWLLGKPVLVNSKSPVLKDHCIDGQGGLFYENFEEFSECLTLLLSQNDLAASLGDNGVNYVKNNFNWDVTQNRYQDFFSNVIKNIQSS